MTVERNASIPNGKSQPEPGSQEITRWRVGKRENRQKQRDRIVCMEKLVNTKNK